MTFDSKFIKKVKDLPNDLQEAVSKLLVFGIMIDGNLSVVERRTLLRLKNDGVLPYEISQVNGWSKSYFNGNGLEEFFNYKAWKEEIKH